MISVVYLLKYQDKSHILLVMNNTPHGEESRLFDYCHSILNKIFNEHLFRYNCFQVL